MPLTSQLLTVSQSQSNDCDKISTSSHSTVTSSHLGSSSQQHQFLSVAAAFAPSCTHVAVDTHHYLTEREVHELNALADMIECIQLNYFLEGRSSSHHPTNLEAQELFEGSLQRASRRLTQFLQWRYNGSLRAVSDNRTPEDSVEVAHAISILHNHLLKHSFATVTAERLDDGVTAEQETLGEYSLRASSTLIHEVTTVWLHRALAERDHDDEDVEQEALQLRLSTFLLKHLDTSLQDFLRQLGDLLHPDIGTESLWMRAMQIPLLMKAVWHGVVWLLRLQRNFSSLFESVVLDARRSCWDQLANQMTDFA